MEFSEMHNLTHLQELIFLAAFALPFLIGGVALETIGGFSTAPGAVFTALTPNTGDSFQIRSADIATRPKLLAAWGWNQVTGVFRVRSPRLHDNVQGIRMRNLANIVFPRTAIVPGVSFPQPLIPQDVLILENTGSGVGGQIETGHLLIYYPSLPGVAARLTDPATVIAKGQTVLGQEVDLPALGVAGGYTGTTAINAGAGLDNFKANTDYALMGMFTDTRCGNITIRGVDSGNLRIGVPGEPTFADQAVDWFMQLSMAFSLPLVPVFNSANKFSIFVEACNNQTAASTPVVTLMMVELAVGAVPGAVPAQG
jgi:hypothetical protein